MAQAGPTSPYVGQTVEVVVGVVGGRDRPKVAPPRLAGASLAYVHTELVPMNLTGIGDMIAEQNFYRSRFRLVAEKAGPLTVPPFVAELGGRRGASAPIRLNVRPLPAVGRPPTFLGGVGAFEVASSVEPSSVRVGQPIEYRLTVRGPGARGTNAGPDLGLFEKLSIAPRVDRLPDIATPEPPTHVFAYRLRPTRPGEVVLPPVSVSAFDPAVGRYVTKAAPGARVRVAAVPRFDPSEVDYGVPEGEGPRDLRSLGLAAFVAAVALTGLVTGFALWSRDRNGRAARRRLRRLIARIGREGDDAEVGRLLTEGLADYFRVTLHRPPGALTPAEAGEAALRATGSDALAERARSLVEECDRARFAGGEGAPGSLAEGGASFLRALLAARRPNEPNGPPE